jgi:hypothetical protein
MSIDFNDANEQRDSLIPDGTYCALRLAIRPGGEHFTGCCEIDLGLFRQSMTSDVCYLDCEFTVISGPHGGRKFRQIFTVYGGKIGEDGVSKAWLISKDLIRAMIDSAFNLDPADKSDATKAKRRVDGFRDLDGLEFFARLGIERGAQRDDGSQYADRNRIAHVVVPGELHYAALKAGKEIAPAPSAPRIPSESTAPAPAAAAKPAWQQDAPAATPPPTASGPGWLTGDKK